MAEEAKASNVKPWLWRKGQSGNPGGRPKGLSRYIREQTREGEELAEFVLSIFRTSKSGRERMEAASWLADRGFGKPRQGVELSGEGGGPVAVASLSIEDIDKLYAIVKRREVREDG